MSFIQSSAIIILTKLILIKQLNIPTNQPTNQKKKQHQKDSYLPTPPRKTPLSGSLLRIGPLWAFWLGKVIIRAAFETKGLAGQSSNQ